MKKQYESVIPDWLQEHYAKIELNIRCPKEFEAVWANLFILQSRLSNQPDSTHNAELRLRNPESLKKLLPGKGPELALMLIIEAQVAKIATFHIYKCKAFFDGIVHALRTGNFATTTVLIRTLLEIVCFQYYVLEKHKKKVRVVSRLLEPQSKKIRRQKKIPDKDRKKIIEAFLDVLSNLDRADMGSDFDWSEVFPEATSLQNSEEQAGNKKIHVQEAIESAEKISKIPMMKYYDLLSEFSHPNLGSHMLLVRGRTNANGVVGDVIFSDIGKTLNHATFFFETFSPSICQVLKAVLITIEKGDDALEFHQNMLSPKLWAELWLEMKKNQFDETKTVFH